LLFGATGADVIGGDPDGSASAVKNGTFSLIA
jgi:hypothetical protein